MTRAELDIQIRLSFEILYPGKSIDIDHSEEDQIDVYVDNMLFQAILCSDDDGHLYFHPIVGGHEVSQLTVRIAYPE